MERDSEADGPCRHPHTQAEQAVPLRAVPHQVGADRLPLELGVSLPHRQGAPVEVAGLEDIEGSLQDLPLAAAKHPETIGQAGRCRAGENALMLPLWTRNSGVCVVQIIWPPSDHLSKSPWILGRCCLYHASSFASTLQDRKKVRQAQYLPLTGQVKTLHKGERPARVPKRVHQGATVYHQHPAAGTTKDIHARRAPAGSPPMQGSTLESSASTGFL